MNPSTNPSKTSSANSASDIVRAAGMIETPGFYAGYGPSKDDLPGSRLLLIHQKIATLHGASAAANFVQMVESLPELSAARFLQALYALEATRWTYRPASPSLVDTVKDAGTAFAALHTALSQIGNVDSAKRITAEIKAEFKKLRESK